MEALPGLTGGSGVPGFGYMVPFVSFCNKATKNWNPSSAMKSPDINRCLQLFLSWVMYRHTHFWNQPACSKYRSVNLCYQQGKLSSSPRHMKPTLGVQPQLEIWDVHSQNTFVQCPELSPHAANSNYFSPAAAGQAQRAVVIAGGQLDLKVFF